MIGRTLGNRYEILSLLGEGGMSRVYLAQDKLLSRRVSIKVLREQYTGDEDFIHRFRREAQAVASLSHPNIVAIYDVGQEDNFYYLVMEYIEGTTLKDIIRQRAPLPPDEAGRIAFQICEALDHAHENGIVHRDIKPHNILVTKKGNIKVTDFGIARAVSSATVTEAGKIVGSVYYISPEQARGENITDKSDLYSLGVVLYEMLTGQVPFTGDSPITIALRHLQNEPVKPSQLNPAIPYSLERVVLKAMAKDPDRRYESAKAMKVDILNAIEDRTGLRYHDDMPTVEMPAVAARTKGKRKVRPIVWFLLPLLLLGLAYGAFLVARSFLVVDEVRVPDVIDLNVEQAQRKLAEAGLKLEVVGKRPHAEIAEGRVIEQQPPANNYIKKTRAVSVWLSTGPNLLQLPDVTGWPEREAEIAITNAGFELNETKYEFHPEVEKGAVIFQDPQGNSKQPEGTKVTLTISQGPEPKVFEMPDLTGRTLDEAKGILDALGLVIGRVDQQESSEYYEGQVIYQDIQPKSQVSQGSTVNLAVSKGPGPLIAPGRATVKIEIPNDSISHEIRIVVIDKRGEREAYRGTHQPGEKFDVRVLYYGEGVIQVYDNGRLLKELRV